MNQGAIDRLTATNPDLLLHELQTMHDLLAPACELISRTIDAATTAMEMLGIEHLRDEPHAND